MRKTPILGLTGPTGSGKGALAAWLAARGAAVVDCDALAREVTAVGHPCLTELVQAFSADILHEDGTLWRARLAQKAFADDASHALLNRITHPHILALARERVAQAIASGAPLVVLDAPVLFESGLDRDCTHTVAVLAPEQTRLERILRRDGISAEAAQSRMSAQPEERFYLERASHIIVNNGNMEDLYKQAEEWWMACIS